MRVTETTRRILKSRRQNRDLKSQGYEIVEGPWEIHRGYRFREVIIDVQISADGKNLYVKTAEPNGKTASYPQGGEAA